MISLNYFVMYLRGVLFCNVLSLTEVEESQRAGCWLILGLELRPRETSSGMEEKR